MNTNLKAFLDMIATSEGTKGVGDDGYNVLVGGTLFHDYADHPRVRVFCKKFNVYSTAAGRYQILAKYFDVYKKQLGLHDFGHDAQDAIAVQMIKECKALDDIEAGRFADAVKKCAHIWASLPGAGYGQHENKIEKLKVAYLEAGGVVG